MSDHGDALRRLLAAARTVRGEYCAGLRCVEIEAEIELDAAILAAEASLAPPVKKPCVCGSTGLRYCARAGVEMDYCPLRDGEG